MVPDPIKTRAWLLRLLTATGSMSYDESLRSYVDAMAMDVRVANIAFPVLVVGMVQDRLAIFTPNSDGSGGTISITPEGAKWLAAHSRLD